MVRNAPTPDRAPVAVRRDLSDYEQNRVPLARLVALPAVPDRGAQRGEVVSAAVVRVLEVSVTLANHGAAQYSITVDNAREPLDRETGPGGQRQRREARRRYEFDDFRVFSPGTRLRIDFRYADRVTAGARKAGMAAEVWTPMVCGPITDLAFALDGASTLRISGSDDLQLLRDAPGGRLVLTDGSDLDAINAALRRTGFPLELADGPRPDFFREPDRTRSATLAEGQSVLDFVQKIAEPVDHEVFLAFDDLDDPESDLKLHVEQSRARRPVVSAEKAVVLEHGRTLVSFAPRLAMTELYGEVRAIGRHTAPSNPTRVVGTATADILSDELNTAASRQLGLPVPVPAPQVPARLVARTGRPEPSAPDQSARAAGDRGNRRHTVSGRTQLSPARANAVADATLRQKARGFVTADGSCIGDPWLRPGQHVRIVGHGDVFDGFYYVTATTHTFGSSGYGTTFSVRRPGLPVSE